MTFQEREKTFQKLAAIYTDANAGLLGPNAATTICRPVSDEMRKIDNARAKHFFLTGEDDFYDVCEDEFLPPDDDDDATPFYAN